jgi:two-component system, NtrC family, response regulator HydG
MLKVLVVDDDSGLRLSVTTALQNTGRFEITEAFDGVNALEKCQDNTFDIVILDVDMPRMNGLEALRQIKEKNPGTIVLMMTAFASINSAVQAVKDGAYNYLSKPVTGDELIRLLDRAVEAHTLISSVAASSPVMMEAGRKIIGNTAQMQKVFNIINKLSKVDTPVLIRGASGTGKELVARAIHFNSARKDEKFVAINCSAIPENLFESELFGHEKGSFTGADQRKIGKFQYAEGGTLFLDEVGDMPLLMQVKLLRVLQEKLFTPVGSNREISTNVRIVAATNRPLEDMIKAGTYREDLFYRLNVIPIFLPQLSERRDDLINLINIFIKKFNNQHGKRITGVSSSALTVLKKYDWPGNIRELENVIEHCFILESTSSITIASLPEALLAATNTNSLEIERLQEIENVQVKATSQLSSESNIEELGEDLESEDSDLDLPIDPSEAGSLDFNAQKEAFEREFIIKALKTFKGRINQTALHANIPKKTLLRKIEKYGIIAKEFTN